MSPSRLFETDDLTPRIHNRAECTAATFATLVESTQCLLFSLSRLTLAGRRSRAHRGRGRRVRLACVAASRGDCALRRYVEPGEDEGGRRLDPHPGSDDSAMNRNRYTSR